MKAGDVMTTGAATIRPDAALAAAAQLMVEHQISGLPVVDGQDRLIGLITEGDFLLPGESGRPHLVEMLESAGAADDALKTRRVSEFMSTEVVTITAETSIEDVIALMTRHAIRRLPVVSGDRVVGIVSRGNLLSALLRRSTAPKRP